MARERGKTFAESDKPISHLWGLLLSDAPISLRELQEQYRGKETLIKKDVGQLLMKAGRDKNDVLKARAQKVYYFFKAPVEEQEKILARDEPLPEIEQCIPKRETNFSQLTWIHGRKLLRELTLQQEKLQKQLLTPDAKDTEQLVEDCKTLIKQTTALLNKKDRANNPFRTESLGEPLTHALQTLERTLATYQPPMASRKRAAAETAAPSPPAEQEVTLKQAEVAFNKIVNSKVAIPVGDLPAMFGEHAGHIRTQAGLLMSPRNNRGNLLVGNRAKKIYTFLSANDAGQANMIERGETLPTEPEEDTPAVVEPKTKPKTPVSQPMPASQPTPPVEKAPVRTNKQQEPRKKTAAPPELLPVDPEIRMDGFYKALRTFLREDAPLSWRQVEHDFREQGGRFVGREKAALAVLRGLIIPQATNAKESLLLNHAHALEAFLTASEPDRVEVLKYELDEMIKNLTLEDKSSGKAARLQREWDALIRRENRVLQNAHEGMTAAGPSLKTVTANTPAPSEPSKSAPLFRPLPPLGEPTGPRNTFLNPDLLASLEGAAGYHAKPKDGLVLPRDIFDTLDTRARTARVERYRAARDLEASSSPLKPKPSLRRVKDTFAAPVGSESALEDATTPTNVDDLFSDGPNSLSSDVWGPALDSSRPPTDVDRLFAEQDASHMADLSPRALERFLQQPQQTPSLATAPSIDDVFADVAEPPARLPTPLKENVQVGADSPEARQQAELTRIEQELDLLLSFKESTHTDPEAALREFEDGLLQLKIELDALLASNTRIYLNPLFRSMRHEIADLLARRRKERIDLDVTRTFRELDMMKREKMMQDAPSQNDVWTDSLSNAQDSLSALRAKIERVRAQEETRATPKVQELPSMEVQLDSVLADPLPRLQPTPKARLNEVAYATLLDPRWPARDQLLQAEYKSASDVEKTLEIRKKLLKLSRTSDTNPEKARLKTELEEANRVAERALTREWILRTAKPQEMADHLDRALNQQKRFATDPIGREVVERFRQLKVQYKEPTLDLVKTSFPDVDERAIALQLLEADRSTTQLKEGVTHLRRLYEAELKLVLRREQLIEACKSCVIPTDIREELEGAVTLTDKMRIVNQILENPDEMDNPTGPVEWALSMGMHAVRAYSHGKVKSIFGRRFASGELNRLMKTITEEQAELEQLRAGVNYGHIAPKDTVTEARALKKAVESGTAQHLSSAPADRFESTLHSIWERSDALRNDLKAFTGPISDADITRFNARLNNIEEDLATYEDETVVPKSLVGMVETGKKKKDDALHLFNELRVRARKELTDAEIKTAAQAKAAEAPVPVVEKIRSVDTTKNPLTEIALKAEGLIDDLEMALRQKERLTPQDLRDIDHDTIELSTRLRGLRNRSDEAGYKTAMRAVDELNTVLDEYEAFALTKGIRISDTGEPLEQQLDNAVEQGLTAIKGNAPKRAALREAFSQLTDGRPVRLEFVTEVQDALKAFFRRYNAMKPSEQKKYDASLVRALELLGMANVYKEFGATRFRELGIADADYDTANKWSTVASPTALPRAPKRTADGYLDLEDDTYANTTPLSRRGPMKGPGPVRAGGTTRTMDSSVGMTGTV